MRFNVDGYDMTFGTPDFTLGRVVGTIGVASASEPRHFVAGPVDDRARSAPVSRRFDQLLQCGRGRCAWAEHSRSRQRAAHDRARGRAGEPGRAHARLPGERICEPDADRHDRRSRRRLVREAGGGLRFAVDAAAIAGARLALQFAGADAVLESPDGLDVRPDDLVHRLDPGDVADVLIFAPRYGSDSFNYIYTSLLKTLHATFTDSRSG